MADISILLYSVQGNDMCQSHRGKSNDGKQT